MAIMTECRKCHSTNLNWIKQVAWGPIEGYVFHYIAICQNCKTRYHVKKTSELYKKLKDIPWTRSKHAIQKNMEDKNQNKLFDF